MQHLQPDVDKRITLNMLAQGAAIHAFQTIHQLGARRLAEIHPNLLALYDRFIFGSLAMYWGNAPGHMGARQPENHPANRHYEALSQRAKQAVGNKCREKGTSARASFEAYRAIGQIEHAHVGELEQLAAELVHETWKIPPEKMDAKITTDVHQVGGGAAHAAIGTCRLVRGQRGIVISARAHNFPVLVQELIKGAAELINLRQLGAFREEEYGHITSAADDPDFEPYQMKMGPEVWRALLAARPTRLSPAQLLMLLNKLEPFELHELVDLAAENPGELKSRLQEYSGGR